MGAATTDSGRPPPTGTPAPRPSPGGSASSSCCARSPSLFLVVLGWSHRWVEEDAFLNFRIVDQIRAGHGPVFNIGQRVEVATSPLWLADAHGRAHRRAVRDASSTSRSPAGLALTGLGLWWVQAGAARLWRREGRSASVVPFGAVVVAALPASWEWATSGLENGLSLAWLGAVMLVLATVARRDDEPTAREPGLTTPVWWRTAGVGVLLGLGPLVRPDLTIIERRRRSSAVLVVRRPRGCASSRCCSAGALALPVLSELFRDGLLRHARAQHRARRRTPAAPTGRRAGTTWSIWSRLLALGAARRGRGGRCRAAGAATRTAPGPLVAALALPVAGCAPRALHRQVAAATTSTRGCCSRACSRSSHRLRHRAVEPQASSCRSASLGVWALVAVVGAAAVDPPGLRPAHRARRRRRARRSWQALTRPGRRPVLADDFIFDDGPLAKRLQAATGKRALVTVTAKQPILDATPARTTLVSLASGHQRLPRRARGAGARVQQPRRPGRQPHAAQRRQRARAPQAQGLPVDRRDDHEAGCARPGSPAPRSTPPAGPLCAAGTCAILVESTEATDDRRALLVEPHRRGRAHPARRAPGRGGGGTDVLRRPQVRSATGRPGTISGDGSELADSLLEDDRRPRSAAPARRRRARARSRTRSASS